MNLTAPFSLLAIIATGALTLAAELPGFRPLFNGKDLTGWKGEGYRVENGTLVCTPKAGNLITEATFSHYILDFEFKLTPGANNGLAIHYPGTGDASVTGMELQILDSTHPKHQDLRDHQFHGGLYGLAAAKQGSLKPTGEWNRETVTVSGPLLRVELNGAVILEANLDSLAAAHSSHEGVARRAGHIGWLGHGDTVFFRNIQIRELPPLANEEGVKAAGFTKIFDGATLNQWKTSPQTTNWTAWQGILKHNGTPGPTTDLWTEKSYKDFTLVFDWRWSGRGERKSLPLIQADGSENGSAESEDLDSGIYLRGNTKSQVNLWNRPIGSGEIFGYRTDASLPAELRASATPKTHADRPAGEWNRMMITLIGERVTVSLNGRVVIDNALLPGIPESGPVGLQHHGTAIDFANLWIKPL